MSQCDATNPQLGSSAPDVTEPPDTPAGPVCVIGAGCSGLAACRALAVRNIPFTCYELGSDVGGNWRYENDNQIGVAYRSLRTNNSHQRMRYPSFRHAAQTGTYMSHADMLRYLECFAERYDLGRSIRFGVRVTAIRQASQQRWDVETSGSPPAVFGSVVVATGHHWHPSEPSLPGHFEGQLIHAARYRDPAAFKDRRVLIVGAGSSGAEISAEISTVAAATFLTVRAAPPILPRHVAGIATDRFDNPLLSALPIRVRDLYLRGVVKAALHGSNRLPEGLRSSRSPVRSPAVISTDLVQKVNDGAVVLRPQVKQVHGGVVEFADGASEDIDCIVLATGYEIAVPFLDGLPLGITTCQAPLYRKIVAPAFPSLFFVGLVDPFGALLPVVEAQAEWVGCVIDGTVILPDGPTMRARLEDENRAARRRFDQPLDNSLWCDFYGYRQQLWLDRHVHRRRHRRRRAAPHSTYVTASRDSWSRT